MAKQKILVLTNGKKLHVVGEDGKYWLTDGQKFRKLSKMIQRVEDAPELTAEPVEEQKHDKPETKKKKPSKPSAAKQQKDAEE